MAKRKHHRTHHRRRRRVGAAGLSPKSPLVKLGAVAVGYFMGDTINTAIEKVVPDSIKNATTAAKYLPAVGEIGIGALLLMKKGKSNLLVTAAGGILAGAGIRAGMKKAGVVSGYQMTPVLAGYQATPVLAGLPPQLSGTPAQLQGFRVNGYVPEGSGSNVMGAVATDNSNFLS